MNELIDLHVHSSCSDGTFTPKELVSLALEKGLKAMALTDHDTTDGVSEAVSAAQGTGLELIPGIELSTEYNKKDIHVLGLGIDHENHSFQEHLTRFRHSRDIRNEKLIHKLREHSIAITLEEMTDRFPGCVWTRAHFARFLYERGYVKEMWDAFDKYLGDQAPCFVPREKVTPCQAVRLIHEGGGLAILAHPLLYHLSRDMLETLVSELSDCGLDGIEALYSANRFSDESAMRQLAGRYGLAVSGGSDFHGDNKPSIGLGSGKGNLNIPYELWKNLCARQIHGR